MANQWLRLWHEMPNDPKWRTIAKLSQQPIPSVISVYVHLLVSASLNTTRGQIDIVPEDIATALDIETDAVIRIMEAMQGRVLDGESITGWAKRQPIREDNSSERTRKWRSRLVTNVTQRDAASEDVTHYGDLN